MVGLLKGLVLGVVVSGMQRRWLVVKTMRRRYVETDDGEKALGIG